MTPHADARLRALLDEVASGRLDPAEAVDRLNRDQYTANLGDAVVDLHRAQRRGRPEAIYGQGKTPDQIDRIARSLLDAGQNALVTRLDPLAEPVIVPEVTDPARRLWHPRCRILELRREPRPAGSGLVGVLAAGTTDIPVAEEAATTLEFYGSHVERAFDVGVAGLHRLLARAELLTRARVLVVVAGMEGALPSVVSGLTRAPVVAVPTSVGYGASFGGIAALLTMLNSCSPGVAVVNIDNGFGAGYLADAINRGTVQSA